MSLAAQHLPSPRPFERMVWFVRSDSKPGVEYRVDLTANRGAGHCSCIDFATRRQPAIDRGEESWTKATSCRHLRAAARCFMRDLFSAMAKSEGER